MENQTVPRYLVVACGSYDGTVFAMAHEHTKINPDGPSLLKPIFIDPDAHPSSVTALALGGDLLVSGSSDEVIQVFSVSGRCRLGCLELHTGCVRHLQFAPDLSYANRQPSHLFSLGEDACFAIWRQQVATTTADSEAGSKSFSRVPAWPCIRQMRRHKGPISAFALHPSCRLALTLSDDKTLRVWNLLRGRQAYTVRLKTLASGATDVSFTPSGRYLLMLCPNRFDLIDLSPPAGDTGVKPLATCEFGRPFSAFPIVFDEDDPLTTDCPYLYLLAAFGNILRAFRCPLWSEARREIQALGETRLPGKRVKVLKVLSWPENLMQSQLEVYSNRRKILVTVSTDLDGSYVRGYAINIQTELGNKGLSAPRAVLPVFTYDIHGIRLTQIDASWSLNEQQQEVNACEMIDAEFATEEEKERDDDEGSDTPEENLSIPDSYGNLKD
ncbi:unnamed protein product [Schistocephalus solidus]|uniref:p21-activated protein kinase-interacting protein 1 n=2 Tax=Schistocephalus solidus TaxID=70667 RepID=A0A0X3Q082_SCHSO|nr:unnamed protein product [Schistocephalus solidus]